MTWSKSFRSMSELRADQGNLDPDQQHQFETARRLAVAIIMDGGLGAPDDSYSILLSGHAAEHGNIGVSVSHRSST